MVTTLSQVKHITKGVKTPLTRAIERTVIDLMESNNGIIPFGWYDPGPWSILDLDGFERQILSISKNAVVYTLEDLWDVIELRVLAKHLFRIAVLNRVDSEWLTWYLSTHDLIDGKLGSAGMSPPVNEFDDLLEYVLG